VSSIMSSEVVTGSGLRLHYLSAGGGGVPVIFVPGWSMSSEVFTRQLAHFSESARVTAFAYDPRGQGRSARPLEGYSYVQHGRDLAEFIAALGLEGVVLAGWSYGVMKLLAYVNQFGTGNVRAAIIIDGAPRGTGRDPATEWVWEPTLRTVTDSFTIRTLEDRAAVSRQMAQWCLEGEKPEDLAWLEALQHQTPDAVAALTNETALYCDHEADLRQLCADRPVLIVAREEWRDVVGNWVAANAPRTRLAILGKHMMFWDRAAQFNALLDGFLPTA
jgi:non-heme chloroperoxidase